MAKCSHCQGEAQPGRRFCSQTCGRRSSAAKDRRNQKRLTAIRKLHDAFGEEAVVAAASVCGWPEDFSKFLMRRDRDLWKMIMAGLRAAEAQ